MEIIVGADHGGFKLKNAIKTYLEDQGHTVIDTGALELNPNDDYPEIVQPAMEALGQNPARKAILVCRNGVGVTIVANKYAGVRAGLSFNKAHAESSRNDDDTNVLTLGADYLSTQEALQITEAWLQTPFENNARRTRRLEEIKKIETK